MSDAASRPGARIGFRLRWLTRGRRTVRLGIKSLWSHRLRSLLTVLGIVFGVCSVIAMLAIGEGLSFEAQEQIRRLGSQNIILQSVKPPEERKTSTETNYVLDYGLTYKDISAIRNTVPGVEVIVPSRVMRRDVWRRTRREDCDIVGTVPWYPEVSNYQVARGRFLNDLDLESSANVCILDADLARRLFPIDEALGRSVRVGTSYYRVVGVMEPRSRRAVGAAMAGAGASAAGEDAAAGGAQHRMYIPLSAARSRFGETLMRRSSGSFEAERVQLHEATVRVSSQDSVIDTWHIISDILARNHKKADYAIIVPLELLRQAERTKRLFTIVLGSIAAISLLVGGIGIMNIMLASVTERTREIGIRRALGARRRDIIAQFLIETVLLSGAGGLIGVALGLSIPFGITWWSEMKTIVTPWSPAIAFSISALVGVVFGIYPAMRAARMDPVEALRHE